MQNYIIDGVKVSVNKDIFKDRKFLRLSLKLRKLEKDLKNIEELDEDRQLDVVEETYTINDELFDLVFGVEQHKSIEQKLREKNGGILTDEVLGNFFSKLVNKVSPQKK